MLDALKEYPREYLKLLYHDYPDGIIIGLDVEIETEAGMFCVNPGIIKKSSDIYFIGEPLYIEMKESKNFVYLVISQTGQKDGLEIRYELKTSFEEYKNEFEVFRYTKNAEMFCHTSLQEVYMETTNRVDQSHVLWSVLGGNILHPMYFKFYAYEILRRGTGNIEDVSFAYQILNGIYDIDIINYYFGVKNTDNEELLQIMRTKLSKMGKRDEEVLKSEKESPKERSIMIS